MLMQKDLEDTVLIASNQSTSLSDNMEEKRLMKRIEFRIEQERKMKKDAKKLEYRRRLKLKKYMEEMQPYQILETSNE